ncbi:uncharacterized protein LOC124406821 isoform X3 [Diprion similis]|uniref:uncharacterized protein LOC124406821 isoform X3 n=1 Tax=Diprion similis TaxID=362088 RepID=UPI001EF8655D|nr:uncharacterized protein LOC124406821 isoform X3 [Diprion similis]
MKFLIAVLAAGLLGVVAAQNGDRALFVKASAFRQQSDANAYLPPFSTQRPPERPRPFQSASTPQQLSYSSQSLNEVTGYPSYQQPSSVYSPPNLGFSQSPPSSPSYSPQPTYQTSRPNYLAPSSQSSSSSFTSSQNYGSSVAQPRPIPSNPPPAFPSSSAAPSPSYQPIGSYIPPKTAGYQPSTPQSQPSQNKFSSGYGGSVNVATSGSASVSGSGYYSPSATPTPSFPTPQPSSTSGYGASGMVVTGSESSFASAQTNSVVEAGSSITEEDLKHPPHIHEIDVQCSKTMMTINIEFNRAFDGVIYSKGFYTDQNCRYVAQGSGQTKYSFTVSLDSCGTQFINDFEGEAGQAYLENVLVLQNEPGIQEVWDTVRRVRCLWEGNINKALSVSLSVDMLNQEIVTFSGDTATARLDIQMGKGPFAPAADGLVKIGETMTLVVSVEGDPGFDLQVHDCIARDETSTNIVQLTDDRGCILKPKLFGSFQKTRDTGNTGASIIAYAFFQAFKFPDVMDLYLECNIELCKTDCEACPEPNQQIDPGRRRRDVSYAATNSSGALSDPVCVGKGFRVIMPDDLSLASNLALEKIEEMAVEEFSNTRKVCMSNAGFYATFSLLLSLLVVSTISSAIFYLKLQRIRAAKMLH